MRSTIWSMPKRFWAEEFPKKTKGGVAPYLFKGVLPAELRDAGEIERCWRLLRDTSAIEASGVRARLYFDEMREDAALYAVLAAASSESDTLAQVIERVSGATKYMFAVNNFERLSPRFAASFGEFVQSMFAQHGAPIGGCEQVVFAGNYSGTAFGVHEGYEHAFLVHLGPGVKDFYCWSRDTYLNMTKGSRAPTFGNYQFMLAHGDHFKMEPGDALYLPALVYHVGRQTEYSVSIAVPLYAYPIERYLTRAVLPNLCERAPFDMEGMSPTMSVEGGPAAVHETIVSSASALFERWRGSELSDLLTVGWYNLQSNGYWEPIAPFAVGGDATGRSEIPLGKLRLKSPYQICWQSGLLCPAGSIRVFLKGVNVVCADAPELVQALRALNSGKAADISVLAPSHRKIFSQFVEIGGLDQTAA